MIIGLVVWEAHLPGCQSLKEKRSVVKSLKDRLHNQFNVSVAETAHQDVHRKVEISACVVSGDQPHASSVLTALDRFVASDPRLRIVDSYTTFY